MTVTREQAEQALEAIKGQWPYDVAEGNVPKLIENWDWLESGHIPFAIVWEEGPDEWAYSAGTGGEVYTDLGTFQIRAAENFPAGVFAEPITSWSVGIHKI
jgi:hypothetical protein